MTIRIELNTEMEARLAAQARARGIPLEMAAARLLEEAMASGNRVSADLTVDDFHAMLTLLAEGSEALPDLPTESFTRDSFYEGRA